MNKKLSTTPDVELLLTSMVLGMGEAIENVEASGIHSLLIEDLIPVDCDVSDDDLVALGFQLRTSVPEPDGAKPIFRSGSLPPRWRKVRGKGTYVIDVYDDADRLRFHFVYKAVFYDRFALMRRAQGAP